MDTLFGRLVAPLAYLRVDHPSKRVYDYWLPLIAGTAVSGAVLFSGLRINVIGEYGLVHGTNQLLQILVGFYVAALAAVATFDRPTMDEVTAGSPLMLGKETLTRRRFISLLFGHLAVVGLALYILGAFVMAAGPAIRAVVGTEVFSTSSLGWSWMPAISVEAALLLRGAITWFHVCLSAHVVVVTLYGVYFLAVRMHTIPKKPVATNPPQLKEAA